MTATPNPFTPDVVDAVMRHMNDEHGADSLVICQGLPGLEGATAARVVDLDQSGITLLATLGSEERSARVPWVESPTDRPAIRHEIVRLFESAQSATGAPPTDPH